MADVYLNTSTEAYPQAVEMDLYHAEFEKFCAAKLQPLSPWEPLDADYLLELCAVHDNEQDQPVAPSLSTQSIAKDCGSKKKGAHRRQNADTSERGDGNIVNDKVGDNNALDTNEHDPYFDEDGKVILMDITELEGLMNDFAE